MRTSAIRSQPDNRNFDVIFEIPDSHRLPLQDPRRDHEGELLAA